MVKEKKGVKKPIKKLDVLTGPTFRWVCLKCGMMNVTIIDASTEAKCCNCEYEPNFRQFKS